MKNHAESGVLLKHKVKRSHKFRDTVLIRIDRNLREAVKAESERTKEPMSRIIDWAVVDYLKSVSPAD
jgi:hypothetical protein